jgi:hypothetical protein
VHITWGAEESGPQIVPPKARGFGTRMIERGLSTELEGNVERDFAREGLIYKMSVSAVSSSPYPSA